MMTFPNTWPSDCPPHDAVDADWEVYRIVANDPPTANDFLTNFEAGEFPNRQPCLRCGLSVFRDVSDAFHTRAKYPKLGRRIAKGCLVAVHGKVKQTFRPSHHTWWVFDGVDRAGLFLVIPEEA